MFRKMRRFKQQISDNECRKILREQKRGMGREGRGEGEEGKGSRARLQPEPTLIRSAAAQKGASREARAAMRALFSCS